MENQSTKKSRWLQTRSFLLPVLIALLFFAFTFSYYPFREKLQYDTDEGLNLMRSMLVEMGHPLYSEVSSDQPPLFNQILALAFRVTGFEVNVARAIVLLFSTLLVWACAQFLQLTWGKLAAILFLPLIILTPRYLNLSVAVMIGIPSIALAAVSMVLVVFWHKSRINLWLVLSGLFLALSVLIKLFTGFLVPIFLIGITAAVYLERPDRKFSWRIFKPALIWSVSFAGLSALLALILVGPRNLWLITYPHVMAPMQESFSSAEFTINYQIQLAIPLVMLGFTGVVFAFYKRNWLGLYPFAWALVAYIMLNFYSPVWSHHQMLVTVPMAMMAAAGVSEGIHSLARIRSNSDLVRWRSLLGAGILAGFLFISIHYAPALNQELMNRPRLSGFQLRATPGKLKILSAMHDHIDQTHWIMTDLPIYAFRVGRPVPPSLATFSWKRLSTGSLTQDDILTAMRKYQPEQVMIGRFDMPIIEDYIQKNYTEILSVEFLRLYLRNDLVSSTQ